MSDQVKKNEGFAVYDEFGIMTGTVKEKNERMIFEPLPSFRRDIRDRLFKYIFGSPDHKEWALSLYNTLEGTHYTNTDDLEFYTLENAVYMHMRNDVSILVNQWNLSFYEHQSTKAPNMPLRMLTYAAGVYNRWRAMKQVNWYSSRAIEIPVPRFYIIYNVTGDSPEYLKLSDLYHTEEREPMLELKIRVHNIVGCEEGKDLGICRPLYEYEWFIERIREYCRTSAPESAVIRALEEMPEGFEIRPYMLANREEVIDMSLYEYDEELHIRSEKEIAKQEGIEEGRAEERKKILDVLIHSLHNKGKTMAEISELLDLSPEEVIAILSEQE